MLSYGILHSYIFSFNAIQSPSSLSNKQDLSTPLPLPSPYAMKYIKK